MCYRSTTSGRWRLVGPALSRTASMLALLALSACSSVPPRVQPPLLAEQPPAPVLPKPQPLQLEDVRWRVVLVDGVPLFSLDARNYEALARNMGQISSWVGEASWQLDFYVRSRKRQEPKTEAVGEPR